MRPQRGHTALEVAIERGVESFECGWIAFVAQRDLINAQLAGSRRETRLEQGQRLETSGNELGAEYRDAFAPRLDRVAAGEVGCSPPQGGIPLRHGRAVLRRQRCPRRGEAPENAVE